MGSLSIPSYIIKATSCAVFFRRAHTLILHVGQEFFLARKNDCFDLISDEIEGGNGMISRVK